MNQRTDPSRPAPEYRPGTDTGAGLIDRIWQEMQRQTDQGKIPKASDHLRDSMTDEQKVDIIYAEYAMRRQQGEQVELADWIAQYPELEHLLYRQHQFESALTFQSLDLTGATDVAESSAIDGVPLTPLSTPHQIGQYRIVQWLTRGGQADVYRAVHPHLHQLVVVKVSREFGSDNAKRAVILKEGRLLAEVDHPNVARVYDAGFHDGRPYVVTEYLSGRTLDDYAAQQSPTPSQSAALVSQLASGLAAAHEHGVVHLDIKPANVIVTPDGIPHLIDFGLGAKRGPHSDTSQAGAVCGTLPFMAPEQARAEESLIGPATDVFGLGALLYYLCVGQPPYCAESLPSTLPRIREGRWQRTALERSRASSTLRQIIERAMALDPRDRFHNCRDLQRALEQVIRQRTVRRRAAAVFLAAGLLGGGGLLAHRGGRSGSGQSSGGTAAPPVSAPRLQIQVAAASGYANLVDRVPLRNGDLLRITAGIPQGYHASLFLWTSEGPLRQLAYYRPPNKPVVVRFPASSGTAVPLTGPPGTEVVWLCVSKQRPWLRQDFLTCFSEPNSPLPSLPEDTVLEVGNREVTSLQATRDFGTPTDVVNAENTARQQLDGVRRRLVRHVDFVRAVAFCHVR